MAVATLLAKAWERASDRAVDGAEGVVGRLVERVRRRFADRGNGEGSEALALLEKAPDSRRLVEGLAAAVDREAVSDPAFGDELAALVGEAERAGLTAGPASQVAWGSGIAQVQNTQGSQVSVRQEGQGRPA